MERKFSKQRRISVRPFRLSVNSANALRRLELRVCRTARARENLPSMMPGSWAGSWRSWSKLHRQAWLIGTVEGGQRAGRQRPCGVATAAPGRNSSPTPQDLVRQHRSGVRTQGRLGDRTFSESPAERSRVERRPRRPQEIDHLYSNRLDQITN